MKKKIDLSNVNIIENLKVIIEKTNNVEKKINNLISVIKSNKLEELIEQYKIENQIKHIDFVNSEFYLKDDTPITENIDLYKILIKVNTYFFNYSELPDIEWSKGKLQDRYNKILLGSYNHKTNTIKIHPIFYKKNLPLFTLERVIFHELLHFADRKKLAVRKKYDKVHNSEFHSRENLYPYCQDADNIIMEVISKK